MGLSRDGELVKNIHRNLTIRFLWIEIWTTNKLGTLDDQIEEKWKILNIKTNSCDKDNRRYLLNKFKNCLETMTTIFFLCIFNVETKFRFSFNFYLIIYLDFLPQIYIHINIILGFL